MERYTSQINNKAITAIISRQIKGTAVYRCDRVFQKIIWPLLVTSRALAGPCRAAVLSRAGAGWAGTAALAAVSAPRGGTAPQGSRGLRLAPDRSRRRSRRGNGHGPGNGPRHPGPAPPPFPELLSPRRQGRQRRGPRTPAVPPPEVRSWPEQGRPTSPLDIHYLRLAVLKHLLNVLLN